MPIIIVIVPINIVISVIVPITVVNIVVVLIEMVIDVIVPIIIIIVPVNIVNIVIVLIKMVIDVIVPIIIVIVPVTLNTHGKVHQDLSLVNRKKTLEPVSPKVLKFIVIIIIIISDGWATDDLVYKWKDVDPVQIVPGLHLPR